MNMSRARGPRYSLEYLTFIATKRKRREASKDEIVVREGTKDEWGEDSSSEKRPRVGFPQLSVILVKNSWHVYDLTISLLQRQVGRMKYLISEQQIFIYIKTLKKILSFIGYPN